LFIKQTIALLLLAAFAISSFSRVFWVADYYVNTAAYSKNCENKAKPKLQCNGKCQMMKKLKQEEQKDQQVPEQKSGAKFEILSSRSFYQQPTHFFTEPSVVFLSFSTIGTPIDRNIPVFHPPGA
jgi:hypothetical protein